MRRWLGAELVRLRTIAGLTQRAVAAELGCSVAKVSYLESGDRAVKARELEDVLFDLYEVPPEQRGRYLGAARAASQQGWWDRWGDEDLPEAERRYLGIEDGATRLRAFLPSIVHGLLQTPDYTTGILRAYKFLPEARIARLVDLRRVRQSVLTREDPLEAHLMFDEAAVIRQVGGPATMQDQLLHIANMAEQLENLTVQIVPFRVGPHGAYFGPFSILEFPWDDDSGLVYVEGLVEARYLQARADVYEYSTLFERLTELALPPNESTAMLRSHAR
jgi:transcriptional regulator with XRE-family HTH domain